MKYCGGQVLRSENQWLNVLAGGHEWTDGGNKRSSRMKHEENGNTEVNYMYTTGEGAKMRRNPRRNTVEILW